MADLPVVDTPADLTRRREALQMGVQEAARQLRFSPRQLEAIERGDWDALPGRAFARGALRSYARLLGVDPQPVLAQLVDDDTRLGPAGSLGTALPRSNTFPSVPAATGRGGVRWGLAGALIVGLLLLAVAFDFRPAGLLDRITRVAAPDAPATAPAAEAPTGTVITPGPALSPDQLPAEQAPAGGGVPAAAGDAPPGTGAPSVATQGVTPTAPAPVAPSAPLSTPVAPSVVAPAPPATDVPTQPAADAASGTGLRVALQSESWLEVRSQGKVLFSGLAPAGTDRRFDATGPVRVIIGNAAAARVEWQGRPVSLGAATKGAVARLDLQ